MQNNRFPLSQKFKFEKGIALGYFRIGESLKHLEEYEKSLAYFAEALPLVIKLGDKKLELYVYKKQAFSYRQLGNTKAAFEKLIKGLHLADEIGDIKFKAKILFELGDFHRLQHNFEEAISYFEKVKKINEEKGEEAGVNECRLLFYISITYKRFDDIEKKKKGINALEEILSGTCSETMSPFNRAVTYNNLGSAYVDIKDFEKGEEKLLKALSLKREINKPVSIAYTLNELATLYLKTEDLQKSLAYAKEAIDLVEPKTDVYLEHDITRNLAHINYEMGNYKDGYHFLEKFQVIKDTILDDEKATALAEMSSKYELGKKEKDLLQKDLLLVQQESRFNRYLLFGLSILGVVLGLFLWSRWRYQKQELEAKKLQELDELKSNFFTNITHEFRTPLTVILNSFSNKKVENEAITISTKEVDIIERNTGRLQNLINQLLDLSKLDAGKMKLQIANDDLSEFLKALSNSFKSLADQKNIQLQFVSQLSNEKLFFDKDKVEKIVSNLITNAVKFTPEGGEVNILLLPKGQEIEIIVKDNGIGISEEALPFIFDRFQQADDSETRHFEGSGIGLALVEQMVKVHNGTIKVESVLGQGSVFTIQIPARQSDYESDQITTTPFVKIAETKHPLTQRLKPLAISNNEVSTDDTKSLILIIEDDPDLRFLLKKQLQETYQIIEATNGRQGIEMAMKEIPDLIVSDVMMPEKSGFDVCAELKQDQKTNHIPIILLTAKATQEEKSRRPRNRSR